MEAVYAPCPLSTQVSFSPYEIQKLFGIYKPTLLELQYGGLIEILRCQIERLTYGPASLWYMRMLSGSNPRTKSKV